MRRESGRKYPVNYTDEVVPEDYIWDDWNDYRDGYREGYDYIDKDRRDKTRRKNSKVEKIKQARRNSPRNKR